MDSSKFLVLLTFAFASLHPGHGASLGEACHPLIPDLQCTTGRGMFCILQEDGISHECECGPAFTSDITGTYCRTTYDGVCLGYNDCNLDRRLECYPTTTWPVVLGDCWCRSGLQFNAATESCVAREGQNCNPNGTAPFDETCGQHADCQTTIEGFTRCRCNHGYESDAQRRCVKTGGLHGNSCNGDEDCDYTTHHLQCVEDSCQCGANYGPDSLGVCLSTHGSACSTIDPCDYEKGQNCTSHNAGPGVCECEFKEYQVYVDAPVDDCRSRAYTYYYGGAPCVPNASMNKWPGFEDTVCTCNPGFVGTHDGLCRAAVVPELGDVCEGDGPQCHPDTYSICAPVGNGTTRSCQCPPNRNSNIAHHLCHLRYGQICHENGWEGHCNTDRQLECDPFVHLCRCWNQFNTIFVPERDACLVLSGGKCSNGDTEFDMRCVDNADCQGSCQCRPGFVESPIRTCVEG